MGITSTISKQKLYLDANIFIYALEAIKLWEEYSQEFFSAIDQGLCVAMTSQLTLAECLVKPFELKNENNINTYLNFLQDRHFLSVIPMNKEIMIEAAKIRAANTNIKLPDAIHAATALRNGCTLFFTNDKRFQTIPGISVAFFPT